MDSACWTLLPLFVPSTAQTKSSTLSAFCYRISLSHVHLLRCWWSLAILFFPENLRQLTFLAHLLQSQLIWINTSLQLTHQSTTLPRSSAFLLPVPELSLSWHATKGLLSSTSSSPPLSRFSSPPYPSSPLPSTFTFLVLSMPSEVFPSSFLMGAKRLCWVLPAWLSAFFSVSSAHSALLREQGRGRRRFVQRPLC